MKNFIIKYLNQQYLQYLKYNKINLTDFEIEDFAIRFAPFVNLINFRTKILNLMLSKSKTSTNDPTLNDPTLNDPTLNDPTLNDPTLNDPTLNDQTNYLTKEDSFRYFIYKCKNNKLETIINQLNLELDDSNKIKLNLNSIKADAIFESNPIIATHILSIVEFIKSNDIDDSYQMLASIEYIYNLLSIDIYSYYKTKTGTEPLYSYTKNDIIENKKLFNDLFDCIKKPINQSNLDYGMKWIITSFSLLMI
jgi:hypothetical protein